MNLWGRFRTFGALRYARITVDHATGRSRGTGFVCFWDKDDAEKVVRQCEIVKREMGVEASLYQCYFSVLS